MLGNALLDLLLLWGQHDADGKVKEEVLANYMRLKQPVGTLEVLQIYRSGLQVSRPWVAFLHSAGSRGGLEKRIS